MTLTRITSDGITDAAIVNADINASAAIAGTKISPDFGSQNIVTTGTITSNDITIQDQQPRLNFVDNAGSPNDPDYLFQVDGGQFVLHDSTNSVNKFVVNTDGHIDFLPNVDFAAGIDVTGASSFNGFITLSSTHNRIIFTDTNDNPDYMVDSNGGHFLVYDSTNNQDKIKIFSDGHIDIHGNVDFISGGIDVTGAITATGDITLTNTQPKIVFNDTDNNPDYQIENVQGVFKIRDNTNSADRLAVNTDGHIDIGGNVDFGAGIDVTGNITVTGTVDGVDVAALSTSNAAKMPLTGGTFTGNVTTQKILPVNDSQFDIGENATRFANGYFDTLYGDGSNLTGINTDLVSDTSPQLGGDLDVNDFDIKNGTAIYEIESNARHNFKAGGNTILNINGNGVDFQHGNNTHADNVQSRFGTGDDLRIYHDGSNSYLKQNGTGDLFIDAANGNSADIRMKAQAHIYAQVNGNESAIEAYANGKVALYYDSGARLETSSTGVTFNGTGAILVPSGTTAQRPSASNGQIRYNSTTNELEGYINNGWVKVKGSGLSDSGGYANNTQATADDLHAYWDCDTTSTTRSGGDDGFATTFGVDNQSGKIGNSWHRGTSATNGVLLTSMPTGNNFTLMFWLMLTNNGIHSSSDGAGIIWLDGALSGGSEGSVILGYDGGSGTNLRFGGNGWVGDGEVVSSSFSTTDVWKHMTITRSSGTTWKFYLNGSLVTTRSETMTVGSSWMLGNYSRVNGNGNTNAHYFRGRFDEIAVWHRTLTDTEISTVYTAQNGGTALL